MELPPGQVALAQPQDWQREARQALNVLLDESDTDAALALAVDGAALYQREAVKKNGYSYCGQAVRLADAGELRGSIRAASKALHAALQTGNTDLLGKAYRDIAIAYSYAGQLKRAEQYAHLALKYPGLVPEQVRGPANKTLGDVRLRQSRFEEAIAYYELAQTSSPPNFRPLVDASLANALIQSGDLPRARSVLDAIPELKDAAQQAQLQRMRGNLLLAEDKPAEALALYQKLAGDAVKGDEGFYQAWAWDGISRSQEKLGNTAESAQALDRAIAIFDKARARFRSDEFKMGLFSDLQSVFERAIALRSKLGQPAEAFDISERSRARALLDAVAGRAQVNRDATIVLDSAQMQAMLQPDEVVVAYHALNDRLLAWVLTRDGIREVKLPALPRNDLERLITAYRTALIGLNTAAPAVGGQIGQLLVQPLAIPVGKRLVIVPHGPLHFLPFQSLRVDGQYLIERNPVSIAPSTSVALKLADAEPLASPSLLAVGDPDPYPLRSDGYEWGRLGAAQEEATVVAGYFNQPAVLLTAAATKQAFESQLASRQIVHLATHGFVDPTDPLESAVLFAGEDPATSYLKVRDVLMADYRSAALVVLSACSTGLGEVSRDDEVQGFTRAFLSSGSGALVSTLWDVADDSTKVLMTNFYGDFSRGEDVQNAMRDAQLAVLHNPATAHPYFWAPFNLIGNWRLRVAQ